MVCNLEFCFPLFVYVYFIFYTFRAWLSCYTKPRDDRGVNVNKKGRNMHFMSRVLKLRFHQYPLTRRNREVIDFTRYRVKNHTKLTNLMRMNRIQGYNGKYGSNPQGIKQFLDVIFKFDQIGREIDGRNWGKWYFKKVDFKSIPRNQKSSNLDLILRRNQDSKWREIS